MARTRSGTGPPRLAGHPELAILWTRHQAGRRQREEWQHREARWALGASQAENRDLVRYGDQTVLLLPRTTAEATVLVSRVLGSLIRHDSERGTQYVNTLRVMLRLDRSWQQAAAELHTSAQKGLQLGAAT